MATNVTPFIISRDFAVSRPLLFRCFTEVDRLSKWWGPKGATILSTRLDFRPGGLFHYGMRMPDGLIIWGRFIYREIAVPERIVFINSFSDEAAGLTRAPFFDSKWPRELLSTFTFEELASDRTRLTITWTPENATAEEETTFTANFASMTGGWGGTLDRLESYSANLTEED